MTNVLIREAEKKILDRLREVVMNMQREGDMKTEVEVMWQHAKDTTTTRS